MITFLLACSSGPGSDGLYGTTPLQALPAPEFTATADDGSARGHDNLIGHPTVLWFYPAAATGG
ncbi:MAG: hypothetical protein H6738_02525 [Alphaproteobacteria bacterium]|nr:hypothetical protein [Alphaproteobacteria bacterium]MCB9695644.1 hypothetical protein [Alphaproteobacteria bacterium]